MLDFRKVLLALSVAGFGIVGSASAQAPATTCTYTAASLAYVAAEGTTEQLPALNITCGTAQPSGVVSFQITTTAPLANQLTSATSGKYDVAITGLNAGDSLASNISATETGPNTLVLTFNSITTPFPFTIGVNNLRVNASTSPLSSTITASVTASGVAISPGASNALGFVNKAISSVVVNAGGNVANTSSCGLLKTTVFPASNVTIVEGFPDSLKSAGEAATAGGTAATQGTEIAVTFTNLDPGVNYYVPGTITGSLGVATLVAVTGPGVPATSLATLTTAAAVPGANFVTVTSAAPTVYYEINVGGGALNTNNFLIPVTAAVPSVSAVTTFNTSPVGASVVLVGATAPAYPGYSGTITYTSSVLATNTTNGLLTPCSTTLLFPYVTNSGGYDTGIAIANASTLPAGVAGITAATGACTLTFYGSGAATASPVTVNYGTVTTGTIGTPVAMGGSSTAAAGLTGYAVAVCNFVGAHGYAFISDSLGSGSGVAANYIAVILSSGADGYSPAPAVAPAVPVITPTN